jgi:hypothetical protein
MDTETADAGFLNARQEAFCREVVAGWSAVAAPVGPDRDRLAAMLAAVGECRPHAPARRPTSAKPP